MNALAFLIAAIGFVGISAFVFFSYPRSWRKNGTFTALLGLWHLTGVTCLISVFTIYSRIHHEGLRHEISRIATIYYIGLMLAALMFLFRFVSSTMYRQADRRKDLCGTAVLGIRQESSCGGLHGNCLHDRSDWLFQHRCPVPDRL